MYGHASYAGAPYASRQVPATVDTVDDLLANDVQSTSNVTTPAITQVQVLLANDVQSTSNVTAPAVGQKHVLLANDVQSTSNVSAPALVEEDGTNDLLANDVQSTSEISLPALTHVIASTGPVSSTGVPLRVGRKLKGAELTLEEMMFGQRPQTKKVTIVWPSGWRRR